MQFFTAANEIKAPFSFTVTLETKDDIDHLNNVLTILGKSMEDFFTILKEESKLAASND